MTTSRIRRFWILSLATVALCALARVAIAEQVAREQDIVNLWLQGGSRIASSLLSAKEVNGINDLEATFNDVD